MSDTDMDPTDLVRAYVDTLRRLVADYRPDDATEFMHGWAACMSVVIADLEALL